MITSIENGRKEDGNRSIADKIIKRLHDLEKTVHTNHGRWAWELVQNAKDSIAETDRKVSIEIIYDENQVTFSHNGDHFTEKDIRGLINQISSKEVEENEEKKRTGKFGTGFLTTHLLSKRIIINGIVRTDTGDFYPFNFPLDRDGTTTSALIPKIEDAWTHFHTSTESGPIKDPGFMKLNTTFSYPLRSKQQKEVAATGVDEFIALIPYVLTFNNDIESVTIVDNVREITSSFKSIGHESEIINLIQKKENGAESQIRLLHASNGKVAIAATIAPDLIWDGFNVRNQSKIPKLFCNFPLIGTDNFHFPIIVNSFHFNPLTERDGIWLNDTDDGEVLENWDLLVQAYDLYKELLPKLPQNLVYSLYNIVESNIPNTDNKYFDREKFKKLIQQPLRTFLLEQKIVERNDEQYGALSGTWLPLKSYTEQTKDKFWKFYSKLYAGCLPNKEDMPHWIETTWQTDNKLTYFELAKDLAEQLSISKMAELFNDLDETFLWYNEIRNFILENEENAILFEKHAAVPNVYGDFKVKNEIFIDKVQDNILIEILKLLGDDWNKILIHKKVTSGTFNVKTKKQIAQEIIEKLKKIDKNKQDSIKAISILSEWFDHNPEDGNELFGELYKTRAELFMNTIEDKESLYKVMRSKTDLSQVARLLEENPQLFENIDQSNTLSILEDFNIKSPDELRDALNKARDGANKPPQPITQETLLSLGITSLPDLEQALENKDLSAQFIHNSNPRIELFIYVQGLIARAKQNVINYLVTLPEYTHQEIEEISPTVIGGFEKNHNPIFIVVRPSDNGEVILYYSGEKNTLDYESSELWIDNGKDNPEMLTLGKILKITGITRIPV